MSDENDQRQRRQASEHMDEVGPRELDRSGQRPADAEAFDQRDRDGEAEEREPDETGKDEERNEQREGNEDEHPDSVREERVPAPQ